MELQFIRRRSYTDVADPRHIDFTYEVLFFMDEVIVTNETTRRQSGVYCGTAYSKKCITTETTDCFPKSDEFREVKTIRIYFQRTSRNRSACEDFFWSRRRLIEMDLKRVTHSLNLFNKSRNYPWWRRSAKFECIHQSEMIPADQINSHSSRVEYVVLELLINSQVILIVSISRITSSVIIILSHYFFFKVPWYPWHIWNIDHWLIRRKCASTQCHSHRNESVSSY